MRCVGNYEDAKAGWHDYKLESGRCVRGKIVAFLSSPRAQLKLVAAPSCFLPHSVALRGEHIDWAATHFP